MNEQIKELMNQAGNSRNCKLKYYTVSSQLLVYSNLISWYN
jgi:hypothetical protein